MVWANTLNLHSRLTHIRPRGHPGGLRTCFPLHRVSLPPVISGLSPHSCVLYLICSFKNKIRGAAVSYSGFDYTTQPTLLGK